MNETDDDKYLAGIDLARLPEHARPVLIALAQFRLGEPITKRCPECGDLIAVEPLGTPPSALAHSCPCGRCNGSVRGL